MRRAVCLRETQRAQTQIDFVVGVSVCVVSLALVVGLIPGLIETPSASTAAAPIEADRLAASLTDVLGATAPVAGEPTRVHAPSTPGVLSPPCTVAFFTADASLATAAGCPFDANAGLDELFGVASARITVVELDASATERRPVTVAFETDDGQIGGTLERTQPNRRAASHPVAVSERLVSIGQTPYRLIVAVW